MIYGTVARWARDRRHFPPVFDKAFAFLAEQDCAALAPGKYPIDGEALFASLDAVRTQPHGERRFETHARYLDIQVLLMGREKQLYAPDASGIAVLEDRLAADDIAFHATPALYSAIILEPGCYVVYFPGEPHCPCCAIAGDGEDIRKLIFKIRWND